MKAAIVPFSAVVALGLRLDTSPYINAAHYTPEEMHEELRQSAKRAYRKHARRGLAHIRNVKEWNRLHLLDGVRKLP